MRRRLLTDAQVRAIAKRYDGHTETIDALVKQYGVARHNVIAAARTGGYRTRVRRIDWTPAKDQYLRDNWGKLPPIEVYAHLQCSPQAVFNRLKRIGHSTRNNEDFTIYDLQHLTRIDHRLWRRFIDDGWLKSYSEYGRNGKTWSRRVKIESLHALLRAHPEIIDYRAADRYVRGVLDLNRLPDPPRFMRVTCRADGWRDGMRATPAGFKIHHGAIELVDRSHHFQHKSCAAIGGTDVWAPLYATPLCPRCGCQVSRFSERAVFSDAEPDEGERLNAIAAKLGLVWRDGRFWTARGKPVTEEELLAFVFGTRRNAGRADLIQMMTGTALGEDWQEFRDAGQIAEVPVRVVIVKDLEQKHRALARSLNGHRTIIFSDAIADGKRIAAEHGIPFIHSGTKDRLQVLREHRIVCMSRVGDCGIDVQDLEEVIEFNFHYGSRAQSLQRLGRLLHSRKPLRHTVMMTLAEFSLYHKRLSVLEEKGFRIRIVPYRDINRRGRPPAPKPVGTWAQLLGVAAPAPRPSPIETNAQKRSRTLSRLRDKAIAREEAMA